MNKTIGLQLVVYSLLLAGLSFLIHHLSPALAGPTLITGLAGGLVCLLLGIRAIGGNRSKALPILALIPIIFLSLAQMISTWAGRGPEAGGRTAAGTLLILLLLISIGMLMRITYAGMIFNIRPNNQAR